MCHWTRNPIRNVSTLVQQAVCILDVSEHRLVDGCAKHNLARHQREKDIIACGKTLPRGISQLSFRRAVSPVTVGSTRAHVVVARLPRGYLSCYPRRPPPLERRLQDTVKEPTSWEGHAVFRTRCTTLTSCETLGRSGCSKDNTF
jgi:hypothetical protein